MSDIDLVVIASREFEHYLRTVKGATGSGLGELLRDLDYPYAEYPALFKVSSLRNGIVHESGADLRRQGITPDGFRQLVRRAENELRIPGRVLAALDRETAATHANQAIVVSPAQTEVFSPVPRPDRHNSVKRPARPWYRNFLIECLLVLFIPPVGILLFLTDGKRGCLARLIVTGLGVLWLSTIVMPLGAALGRSLPSIDLAWPTHFALPSFPTQSWRTAPLASPNAANGTGIPESSASGSADGMACQIVWVPAPQATVAGKNRSMVWEELVEPNVDGSEMTPREFFDGVVEHNPSLIEDGYVFADGRVYLLPACR